MIFKVYNKSLKNGFYEVLIETDYIQYELYKNDICICGVEMIIACDLNIWYKILNKNFYLIIF